MKLQTGTGATLTRSLPFDTMAEDLLHKIAGLLVTKAKITTNLQLPMGRAGLSLFLFHYYRFTKNEEYYIHAYELLDKLYESVADPAVPVQKSVQIQLGWLFMYLQNHDFIDLDTEEILANTDKAVFDTCVNGSLKHVSDGYVTDIGAYLVMRHGNTSHKLKRLKTEEAMINLVDEIRLLYPNEIKEKFIEMAGHGQINGGMVFNKLVRVACNLCILLAKIAGLGVYRGAITNTITDMYEKVLLPVLQEQQLFKSLSNNYPGYATLVYTIYTKSLIAPYITNVTENDYYELIEPSNNQAVYSSEQTPYTGDLLLTIACLRNLHNITFTSIAAADPETLTKKLCASVNKNAPGYLGSQIGIPDLGLKAGMAGTGMALLQALKDELLVNDDILLMTIK